MLRFDYSGHGESGGSFADGTIGRWLEESEAVFRACCHGPQVAVGSSMGGWLAMLLYRHLQRSHPAAAGDIKGLVLLAPTGTPAAIVQRSRGVSGRLNMGVNGLLKKNKVQIIWGEAKLSKPGEVVVAKTAKAAMQPQHHWRQSPR